MKKPDNFFWQIYDDINAIAGIFTACTLLLSVIHGLNTFDFGPFCIVVVFILPFWFLSSLIRRFG